MKKELFRFDPEGNIKPELYKAIRMISKHPAFAEYDDMQIEKMLLHHNPEEIIRMGPEEAMDRYNALSIRDGLDGLDLGL